MPRLIPILAVLALVSCGRPAPEVALRAEGAPIYSSAVLDRTRLEGEWQQVGTFVAVGSVDCTPGGVRFQGGMAEWDLCLAGGPSRGAGAMVTGLPGRFTLPGMAEWWVLWVDADYRTALIGTPGGEFGFVLNRGGPLPPDRLQAVRDIATFNGYHAGDLALF